jgi:hypothetical protein
MDNPEKVKGQSRMDNPEKLAAQGTQDEEKQSKNTTQQVLDTIVLKTHKQLLFVYFIPRV